MAGRYLLYAVGEIVLVVIGILIALSINNWNETHKNRKEENLTLINLKLEFDSNQKILNDLILSRQNKEKSLRIYLNLITNDSVSMSQKTNAHVLIFGRARWGSINTVLNSLVNTGKINLIQNDSLKVLLTNWPTYVTRFKQEEERFFNCIGDVQDYESSILPQPIVKEGDYREAWPGFFYPPSMEQQFEQAKVELSSDLKYYNLITRLTAVLYIYSKVGIQLKDKYEDISKLISKELDLRGIEIPE